MPYRYLDDIASADVAFCAAAPALEGMFLSAADATTQVMVEGLETVRPLVEKDVALEAEELDILLVRFLGELVFFKDAENLLLRARDIEIRSRGSGYELRSRLAGEPIAPARHRLKVDIKAVTLHRLRVEHTAEGWECRVVLDI
jgi:SHS2 domain-containing protein